MTRARLALALLIVLLLPGCTITAKQWERFRAHGTASVFSLVMGGLAVALGGPVGLAVGGGGLLGGVLIDQALEPEPTVIVKKTTTVVQHPPPLPDGTPQQPRVDTYTTQDDGETTHDGARGNLKLRAPTNLPSVPEVFGWWEQTKRILGHVAWALAAVVLLTAALSNDWLRRKLFAFLASAAVSVPRGFTALGRAIAERRKGRMPPKSPGRARRPR
jgi:hypothetical protein